MVGWIIVLVLALLFLLVWLMRVGVFFSYQEKIISFKLKIGLLSVTILPKKELSERQKQRAAQRKAKKEAKKNVPDTPPAPSYDRKELIKLLIPELPPLLERLGEAVYLEKCLVSVAFGFSDPYYTAVAYGSIHALFGQIWALMEHHIRMNDVHIHLEPDFNHPGVRAEGSVLASVRVGRAVVISIWFLMRLLKHYRTAQRMYQEKQTAEQATPESQAAS